MTLERDIRARLAALVDPAYRVQITRLVATDAPLLGVRVPAIRTLAKDIDREHALDDDAAIALLHSFTKRRCREELLLGIFIVARSKRRIAKVRWQDLDAWVDAIENWEVCDQLAMTIGRARLCETGALARLVSWAGSPNRWRRRFAVATVATAKLPARDVELVLARVADDRDPMVKKAIAWARREMTE